MLAPLAAALFLHPAAISFETRAARVPGIMRQLQAKTGLKLDCDGVFENEVLVIRVTDVAPATLLDKIGTACTAVWEKQGDRLILRPDIPTRKRQEGERMDRRIARVKVILDRCEKELRTPYLGEKPPKRERGVDPDAKWYAAQRNTPLNRFAMRLLFAIGAKRLAAIERGERVVFAQNPNRLQMKWPEGGESAIAEFRKDWTTLTKMGSAAQDGDQGALLGGWSSSGGRGVTLTPDSNFPYVWISVPDLLAGGYAHDVNVGIQNENFSGFGENLELYSPTPDPATAPSALPLTEFNLDESTRALNAAYDNSGAIRGQKTIGRDNVLAKLLIADDFEPLSMGSELMIQLAELRKSNLVALVNDGSQVYFTRIPLPVTARTVDDQMRYVFNLTEQDGWIIATPKEPVDARRLRENRKTMRLLIREALGGKLPLRRECEYLAGRPAAYPIGLALRYVALFDSNIPIEYWPLELASKRIFALLGDTKFGDYRFEQLPKAARAEINRAFYSEIGWPGRLPPPGINVPDRLDNSRSVGGPERTVAWPDGIPADSAFTFTVEDMMEVREIRANHLGSGYDTDLIRVASQRYLSDNPTQAGLNSSTLKGIAKFQPIQTQVFKMRLVLEDFFTLHWIKDKSIAGEAGKFENLPEAFKKQIQVEYDKIKAQRQGSPPPP